MGTVVDLLLLAVVIVFVFSGMKNGFVRTLLSFAARILSVVLAYFVSDKYDEAIYEKILRDSVINGIEERVVASPVSDVSQRVSVVLESVPESILGILEALGLDLTSFDKMVSASASNGEISSFLEETLAGPASVFVCRIIIFAFVSFLASLVFSIIINLLCKIVKLPVLRTANKALGGALGLFNGIIFALIVSYICVIVSGLINNSEFSEIVNSSHVIEIFTSTMNGFIGV